jgi:4-hydroxy-4-methyl-2-oxoglutarate aldolase
MPVDADSYGLFAGLGVSTVYEAAGRQGLIEGPLIQIIARSRAAGPARTVVCGQNDNLMVHAAIERIQAGDVVVLAMPEPRAIALLGELLALQVHARGAAAVLVDGAVRDYDELVKLGLPIWARWVSARGATKDTVGRLDGPVTVGGVEINPGDLVVLDADGVVCVPAGQVDKVLAASQAREAKENALRPRLLAGELTYDLHGLRAGVEQTREE